MVLVRWNAERFSVVDTLRKRSMAGMHRGLVGMHRGLLECIEVSAVEYLRKRSISWNAYRFSWNAEKFSVVEYLEEAEHGGNAHLDDLHWRLPQIAVKDLLRLY